MVTFPSRSLEWALEPNVAEKGEFLQRTGGGVLPVLRALCNWFRGRELGNRATVFLADATEFSSIVGRGTLDIVNVDPPYFEQVVYSDKIEFIWVLMRRALSPALDILFPEKRVRIDWSPKGEKGARLPRRRELVVRGKSRSEFREGDPEIESWRTLFKELCTDFAKVLKDDGILVLWFTHPSDIAWRSVGEALYDAGFVTSKVYPMFSEMPTRFVSQVHKVAQQISLAIVAKKASRERLMGAEDMAVYLAGEERFTSLADRLASEALSMARSTRLSTVDAFALTLGTAISVATHFDAPIRNAFKDLYSAAITQVIERFVGGLLKDLFTGERPVRLVPDEAEVVEGRIQEGMLHEPAARAYMPLLLASRVDFSSGWPYSEPKNLDFDFAQTVSKLCGFDLSRLSSVGLIKEVKGDGKAYIPMVLETMEATVGRVPLKTVLSTLPGRAIFATYTAIREAGRPETRAKIIEDRIKEETDEPFTRDDFVRAAAFGLLLLNLLTDSEITRALKQSLSGLLYSGTSTARQSLSVSPFLSGAVETLKAIVLL